MAEIPHTTVDPISETQAIHYEVPDLEYDYTVEADPLRPRRFSVSAESGANEFDNYTPPINPKTEDQVERIRQSVNNLFLWRGLAEEQRQEFVDAMTERRVRPGEEIIRQGTRGDFFYVIEFGRYEVWKSTPLNAPPTKVFTYENSGSFGELALMYTNPRAASVRAVSDGCLWQVDRMAYRHITIHATRQKRVIYDSFLRKVPLFRQLKDVIRAQIADSLTSVEFRKGEILVRQGGDGEQFFIIESGMCLVTQDLDGMEREIRQLQETDYFGERALLVDEPRSANVRALSETVRVLTMEKDSFIRLLGPLKAVMMNQMKRYVNVDAGSRAVNPSMNEYDVADDGSDISDFEINVD